MKKSLKIAIALLALLVLASAIYLSDGYAAGPWAEEILQTEVCHKEGTYLSLEVPGSEIGFVFYPGAKVEYTAYLPLMERLYQEGISCYLVKMPFNLAILGSNRGAEVMDSHPEIHTWYLGGHSMGGAFAGSFAESRKEEIAGLILLGAYRYGEYPREQTYIIYGEKDEVLHREKIDPADYVAILSGGNHAQFGDYGPQKGDGIPSITLEEQIEQTSALVMAYIK